jgi:invasion protein IalB
MSPARDKPVLSLTMHATGQDAPLARPSAPARTRLCLSLLSLLVFSFPTVASALQFQAGDWTTDCEIEKKGSGDCSIIGVLKGNGASGTKGSFALAVELQTGQVVLVGKPDPIGAVIRVDKSQPTECRGTPCLVPSDQAETLIAKLSTGRLVLVDLFSRNEIFRLSITTAGYRSGLSKILAHRDLLR